MLLRNPARSRADLGRALGLSRATVTALLSELEQVGMVEQQPDDSADDRRRAIGRPPLQVSLAANAAYAVGLDFGHSHVRSAVCDLSGRILADQWAQIDVDDHPMDSLDLAHRLTEAALKEAGAAREYVIGVGVGLAAPVDARHGAVHSDGILPGWDAIQPARELERRLGPTGVGVGSPALPRADGARRAHSESRASTACRRGAAALRNSRRPEAG